MKGDHEYLNNTSLQSGSKMAAVSFSSSVSPKPTLEGGTFSGRGGPPVEIWDFRDQGVSQVTPFLSHVTWCVFVYSDCVPLSIVCVGEHTICAVCESADGTPQHAFFSQQQWKLIQENNPALGLCCGAAHCPWRCAVVCLYRMCTGLCTPACVCCLV